jgi:polysaccharide export outer membrane protein
MMRPTLPASPKTKRLRWVILLPLLAFLLCCGCQTHRLASLPDNWVAPQNGCLAPGDVVRLSYSGAPEYNQIQKVRSDGRISVPIVGEIIADGKKPGQLQKELATLYKPQMQNNEVVVSLESSSVPVYVSGYVNHPGRIAIDRPTTVLEAIMEAGGFQTGFANPKKVVLVRKSNGQHIPTTLDLSAALKGQPMATTYVTAYDVIYVPESIF